ncbi:hypothetical protein Trichorick_01186 [Candidatus Trichorickettsia mobilis]|uniref:Uncharacterized protein n=1 Tax=Candidatus Trichorickettsia mobilis TaxID=1346319 RepID=A0ABZ0UTD0_9RICK|nr:hypothetical protein [Candidatus Trichorickettsia mobilis]WPY01277.1 hypothetical protein Trichorick_01186 [Candidatus Trichorickettsia mobilis]
MLRYLMLFPLFLSFVNSYAIEEAKPVFDDRKWMLAWSKFQNSSGTGKPVFDEYVISGETVDNWSELVTVQFFPGLNKDINLDVFEAQNKASLTAVCPNVDWQSLYQKPNERMWLFTSKDCSGQPDQSELAKVVKTDEGIHFFHYAIKKAPMPELTKETWKQNLISIQIKKAG